MNTITELTTLESIHCYRCDCIFAMSETKMARLRQTGEDFFCPNGHGQVFGNSENKRLRTALEEKQREVTTAKCETMAERQKREAVEAEMKRHERRTKNGVCPCCRRTFVKLANHIAKAHPDYGPKQTPKLP